MDVRPPDGDTEKAGDEELQRLSRYPGLMIPRQGWPNPLLEFEKKWTEYKRENGLLDFSDLIETSLRDIAVAPKAPSVIFADEAQDLNRMQLTLVRKWGERANYFIVAGDDDQTIFSFTGATPDAFLDPEIPADHKIILNQSYRVPRAVHGFAEALIRQVTRRQEKDYLPRPDDGALERLSRDGYSMPEYSILRTAAEHLERGQTVMFLAACSYMLRPLIQVLRKEGIPFHNPYRKTNGFWNPLRVGSRASSANRVLALLAGHSESGESHRPWTYGDLALWTDCLRSDGTLRQGAKKEIAAADSAQIVTAKALNALLEAAALDSLIDAFEQGAPAILNWWRTRVKPAFAERLKFPAEIAQRRGTWALTETPQVVVGTIHSVKGGQADVVYLFPDLSQAGDAQYRRYGQPRDSVTKSRVSTVDALGRLSQVTENPSGLNYSTSYSYDALDDLTDVSQNGQARTFVYDTLKRLTSATNPESGTINYSSYDNFGNVTTRTDTRATANYTYDPLGRIVRKTYTGVTTPEVKYCYDGRDPYSYGCPTTVTLGMGRLRQIKTSLSTTDYSEYDQLGRVTRHSQTTNGQPPYPFQYAYNLAGSPTTVQYPSGHVVTSPTDAVGRPLSVSMGAAYASNASYSPHGALAHLKLGNNVWENRCYNGRLQPSVIAVGTTATTGDACPSVATDYSVLKLSYDYGSSTNNGNMMGQTINAAGSSFAQSYTYDGVNRLKTAAEGSNWTQTYVYDPNGNRAVTAASSPLPSGTFTPQVSSDNPSLVQSQFPHNQWNGVTYDNGLAAGTANSGNVTGMGAWTLAYDAENRLVTAALSGGATTTYGYDGEGRRVTKSSTTGEAHIFVYDALGRLAAESATGVTITTGREYLMADHLGSTRLRWDTAGALHRYDYLPFGEGIPPTGSRTSALGYGSDTFNVKFTGKERDAETISSGMPSGLDFFGARYFSSAQGRFSSPDTILFPPDLGDPQSWNKYGYALNSPLRFVDPDGQQALDANVRNMLELLRAPLSKTSGAVKGGLLQYAVEHTVTSVLGEIFGYNSRAVRGGLSPEEKQQLDRVSSFEKGHLMLGVGRKEAPGIDAVDLDDAVGISLKSARSLNAVGRNVEEALQQIVAAGFYNIQVYVDALGLSTSDVTGLTKVQRVLGARVTKVVIFTKNGSVTYMPTPEQKKKAEDERRDAQLHQTGWCPPEQSRCP